MSTDEATCLWCGSTFNPKNSIQRTCSRECGRRLAKDKEKAKLRADTARRRAERALNDRTCPHCQTRFTHTNPLAVYCSDACKTAVMVNRRAKVVRTQRNAEALARRCKHCGEPIHALKPVHAFDPDKDAVHRRKIYCSSKCQLNASKARYRSRKRTKAPFEPRTCGCCEAEFVPNKGNQIYCTHACSEKAKIVHRTDAQRRSDEQTQWFTRHILGWRSEPIDPIEPIEPSTPAIEPRGLYRSGVGLRAQALQWMGVDARRSGR